MGARIGRGCHLGSGRIDVPDLIEIGDEASIGYDVDLDPAHVANGWLTLATVRVGAGAYVGTNSVISGGGTVGARARVAEQSLVAGGQTIPDGDRLILKLPGGAGMGDPIERDPALVACDVRDGLVSAENARDLYKVVVTEDGALDAAGTNGLRSPAAK